jgi:hypothetical protein
VIIMAIGTLTPIRPLDEAYFTRAARDLNDHYSDHGHACTTCGAAWPCAKALAAAFILELHT